MQRGHVVDHQDIINVVNSDTSLRNKALISTLYLSNSRVSEICYRLRTNQIVEKKIAGEPCLVFEHLWTLKRKKTEFFRNIPINQADEPELCNIIIQYRDTLGPESIMFPMTRQHSWRIIKKVLGSTNHDMRHTRLTHLVTQYNFSDRMLKNMAGWAGNYADTYVHLRTDDIVKQMKK